MKILELFSGYGTASFALKRLGIDYELIGYSDIDKYANQCFKQNHCTDDVNDKLRLGDVKLINPNDLEDFDLLTGGFPCQSFSVAGKGLGELDARGTLFYEIIRIAEVKKPRYMLLENVKGLTNKNHRQTFEKILSELSRIGYKVHWKILNTKNYGVPQNRERVWFACFREQEDYDKFKFPEPVELKIFIKDILEEEVSDKYYLSPMLQERFIKYLENKSIVINPFNKKQSETTSGTIGTSVGGATGKTAQIVRSSNEKTRDINEALEYALHKANIEGHPSQVDLYHLQHGEIRPLSTYVPEDSKVHRCIQAGEPKEILVKPNIVYDRKGFDSRTKEFRESELSPTLSTKMGTGGNNVPMVLGYTNPEEPHQSGTVLDKEGICNTLYAQQWKSPVKIIQGQLRRLTPKECFRLMGFLNDEINLEGLSDTQRYKLAGNGQDVNMVSLIFKQMFL